MNPDDIINFDDFLFVEAHHGIDEDYNSLSVFNQSILDDPVQKNVSVQPKPKLLPKPHAASRKDGIPKLSREPSTSNDTPEDEDENLISMSVICDSMINKLNISKNCDSRGEVLDNTDKELNDFQLGLASHNSFLMSTAQQLKNSFDTIKNLIAENEILSKELKISKTEFDVLKGILDGASTSSQQASSSKSKENESHLKILELEGKNDKLNALYLDSRDKVRSVQNQNDCIKMQLNEANEELNKKSQEIDFKNLKIGELHERLNLLTCQSETYKNDYEEQRRTNNNIVAENETLKARLRSTNRDSELFSAELNLGDSDMVFRCPLCQVEFRSYSMVENHVENCQNN